MRTLIAKQSFIIKLYNCSIGWLFCHNNAVHFIIAVLLSCARTEDNLSISPSERHVIKETESYSQYSLYNNMTYLLGSYDSGEDSYALDAFGTESISNPMQVFFTKSLEDSTLNSSQQISGEEGSSDAPQNIHGSTVVSDNVETGEQASIFHPFTSLHSSETAKNEHDYESLSDLGILKTSPLSTLIQSVMSQHSSLNTNSKQLINDKSVIATPSIETEGIADTTSMILQDSMSKVVQSQHAIAGDSKLLKVSHILTPSVHHTLKSTMSFWIMQPSPGFSLNPPAIPVSTSIQQELRVSLLHASPSFTRIGPTTSLLLSNPMSKFQQSLQTISRGLPSNLISSLDSSSSILKATRKLQSLIQTEYLLQPSPLLSLPAESSQPTPIFEESSTSALELSIRKLRTTHVTSTKYLQSSEISELPKSFNSSLWTWSISSSMLDILQPLSTSHSGYSLKPNSLKSLERIELSSPIHASLQTWPASLLSSELLQTWPSSYSTYSLSSDSLQPSEAIESFASLYSPFKTTSVPLLNSWHLPIWPSSYSSYFQSSYSLHSPDVTGTSSSLHSSLQALSGSSSLPVYMKTLSSSYYAYSQNFDLQLSKVTEPSSSLHISLNTFTGSSSFPSYIPTWPSSPSIYSRRDKSSQSSEAIASSSLLHSSLNTFPGSSSFPEYMKAWSSSYSTFSQHPDSLQFSEVTEPSSSLHSPLQTLPSSLSFLKYMQMLPSSSSTHLFKIKSSRSPEATEPFSPLHLSLETPAGSSSPPGYLQTWPLSSSTYPLRVKSLEVPGPSLSLHSPPQTLSGSSSFSEHMQILSSLYSTYSQNSDSSQLSEISEPSPSLHSSLHTLAGSSLLPKNTKTQSLSYSTYSQNSDSLQAIDGTETSLLVHSSIQTLSGSSSLSRYLQAWSSSSSTSSLRTWPSSSSTYSIRVESSKLSEITSSLSSLYASLQTLPGHLSPLDERQTWSSSSSIYSLRPNSIQSSEATGPPSSLYPSLQTITGSSIFPKYLQTWSSSSSIYSLRPKSIKSSEVTGPSSSLYPSLQTIPGSSIFPKYLQTWSSSSSIYSLRPNSIQSSEATGPPSSLYPSLQTIPGSSIFPKYLQTWSSSSSIYSLRPNSIQSSEATGPPSSLYPSLQTIPGSSIFPKYLQTWSSSSSIYSLRPNSIQSSEATGPPSSLYPSLQTIPGSSIFPKYLQTWSSSSSTYSRQQILLSSSETLKPSLPWHSSKWIWPVLTSSLNSLERQSSINSTYHLNYDSSQPSKAVDLSSPPHSSLKLWSVSSLLSVAFSRVPIASITHQNFTPSISSVTRSSMKMLEENSKFLQSVSASRLKQSTRNGMPSMTLSHGSEDSSRIIELSESRIPKHSMTTNTDSSVDNIISPTIVESYSRLSTLSTSYRTDNLLDKPTVIFYPSRSTFTPQIYDGFTKKLLSTAYQSVEGSRSFSLVDNVLKESITYSQSVAGIATKVMQSSNNSILMLNTMQTTIPVKVSSLANNSQVIPLHPTQITRAHLDSPTHTNIDVQNFSSTILGNLGLYLSTTLPVTDSKALSSKLSMQSFDTKLSVATTKGIQTLPPSIQSIVAFLHTPTTSIFDRQANQWNTNSATSTLPYNQNSTYVKSTTNLPKIMPVLTISRAASMSTPLFSHFNTNTNVASQAIVPTVSGITADSTLLTPTSLLPESQILYDNITSSFQLESRVSPAMTTNHNSVFLGTPLTSNTLLSTNTMPSDSSTYNFINELSTNVNGYITTVTADIRNIIAHTSHTTNGSDDISMATASPSMKTLFISSQSNFDSSEHESLKENELYITTRHSILKSEASYSDHSMNFVQHPSSIELSVVDTFSTTVESINSKAALQFDGTTISQTESSFSALGSSIVHYQRMSTTPSLTTWHEPSSTSGHFQLSPSLRPDFSQVPGAFKSISPSKSFQNTLAASSPVLGSVNRSEVEPTQLNTTSVRTLKLSIIGKGTNSFLKTSSSSTMGLKVTDAVAKSYTGSTNPGFQMTNSFSIVSSPYGKLYNNVINSSYPNERSEVTQRITETRTPPSPTIQLQASKLSTGWSTIKQPSPFSTRVTKNTQMKTESYIERLPRVTPVGQSQLMTKNVYSTPLQQTSTSDLTTYSYVVKTFSSFMSSVSFDERVPQSTKTQQNPLVAGTSLLSPTNNESNFMTIEASENGSAGTVDNLFDSSQTTVLLTMINHSLQPSPNPSTDTPYKSTGNSTVAPEPSISG